MKNGLLQQQDKKFLYWSIAGHIGLLLFLTVRVYMFPADRDFVRSVRVDLVALPDKNPPKGKKSEKAKPAKEKPAKKSPKTSKKTVSKKKPKKKKGPGLKKAKNQQQNALDRLRALKRLKEKAAQKEEAAAAVYKGNKVSQGTSLEGVEKLQHDRYSEELDEHIKNYWELPAFLDDSDQLRAILLVKINQDGFIVGKSFVQKSGNHVFDQRAIQAIERAAPLPKPPESLAGYLKIRGIELRFPE